MEDGFGDITLEMPDPVTVNFIDEIKKVAEHGGKVIILGWRKHDKTGGKKNSAREIRFDRA